MSKKERWSMEKYIRKFEMRNEYSSAWHSESEVRMFFEVLELKDLLFYRAKNSKDDTWTLSTLRAKTRRELAHLLRTLSSLFPGTTLKVKNQKPLEFFVLQVVFTEEYLAQFRGNFAGRKFGF